MSNSKGGQRGKQATEAPGDDTWPWGCPGKETLAEMKTRQTWGQTCQLCEPDAVTYYTHGIPSIWISCKRETFDSQAVPYGDGWSSPSEHETPWLWLVLVTQEDGSCSHTAPPEAGKTYWLPRAAPGRVTSLPMGVTLSLMWISAWIQLFRASWPQNVDKNRTRRRARELGAHITRKPLLVSCTPFCDLKKKEKEKKTWSYCSTIF